MMDEAAGRDTGLNIFYFISMEGLVEMKPTFCFKSFYAGMTAPFY
jgi:hypothetical protein